VIRFRGEDLEHVFPPFWHVTIWAITLLYKVSPFPFLPSFLLLNKTNFRQSEGTALESLLLAFTINHTHSNSINQPNSILSSLLSRKASTQYQLISLLSHQHLSATLTPTSSSIRVVDFTVRTQQHHTQTNSSTHCRRLSHQHLSVRLRAAQCSFCSSLTLLSNTHTNILLNSRRRLHCPNAATLYTNQLINPLPGSLIIFSQ